MPFARRHHRRYLPLFPRAIESLDFAGYDLLVSTSHSVAKGARKPEGARHLCYIHTPMRYAWDLYDEYFGPGRADPLTRLAARFVIPRLRAWDRATAGRVDRYCANSRFVAERVRRCYGADADVVHPPVEADRFRPDATERGDYYLMVTALAPYKKVDLAIEAFARNGRPLWIAGAGQESPRIARLAAAAPNVKLLGAVEHGDLPLLYARCRAFVHPQEEDFGIACVEAQACGRPVIAYRGGGALETVTEETGVFFDAQTAEALSDAVARFEEKHERSFDPAAARRNAERFARPVFVDKLRAWIAANAPGAFS
jgi:glycosyltransferase involved in cell wall biosynthesis